MPIVIAALLIAPGVAFVSASSGAHADAGSSVVAPVGTPLPLAGHVEGFSGAVATTWSGPADCTIAAPTSLVTTASCPEPGSFVFTLTATAGAATATDTVRHETYRDMAQTIASGSGTAAAPMGGNLDVGRVPMVVPPGTTRLTVTLDWTNGVVASDLDLHVLGPVSKSATGAEKPKVVTLDAPRPVGHHAAVSSNIALQTPWTVTAVADVREGGATLPTLHVRAPKAILGAPVTVEAETTGDVASIAWELDPASRRFDDGAGSSVTFTFAGPTTVRAKVTDPAGREIVREGLVLARGPLTTPLTVVAVIDSAYSPYHEDFLGRAHPWNTDADPANDLDFSVPPQDYIVGHPGATALGITLPGSANDNVDALRLADSPLWGSMASSSAASPSLYWFPGTKVVAAARFGGTFQGSNGAHGTASASVAAGNVHGSCPECLFVLLSGDANAAIRWATAQPWIDVITNSYGHGSVVQGATLGLTRDNMYWKSPLDATRAASEEGQVIVFSAGNGLLNAFDVPAFTYWSSQKGPDWMVTVGAVSPSSKQTYSGAGKPVDISSIGSSYPSSGGSTAGGEGAHGGTSNAAPVTAGYFAKVLQEAREALGDLSPGRANGVIASGAPVACGSADPACPLGDGILTRRELEDLVYRNVKPSTMVASVGTVWPSTEYAYYYQGHGVLSGKVAGLAGYEAEVAQIVGNMLGATPAYPRPKGEENWFVVDSKCRQTLWGSWNAGLYSGTTPALDPQADPLAFAFNEWCSKTPDKPFPSNLPV